MIFQSYAARLRDRAAERWKPRLEEMQRLRAAGISAAEIGRRYGVHEKTVREVLRKYKENKHGTIVN